MISFIVVALKIIILLGFLIFIHELGHFTVAKLCKVKVNEFALGFGPAILSKQGKETKYQLRLIPLGGFVSMEGETERSEERGSFSKTSIPKRIAIVAAGGLVNIIFATVLFFGIQTFSGNNITTKVSEVTPGYAAETCGILPGDEIVKINGKRVRRLTDINKIVSSSNGENLVVTIKRAGSTMDFNIKPTSYEYKATGIYLGSDKDTTVHGFDSKDSIEGQGIEVGDKIIYVNGVHVEDDYNKLSEAIQIDNDGEENIEFIIKRHGEEHTVSVVPKKTTKYLLGVGLEKAENKISSNMYYAWFDTGDFVFSIVENVKMMFSGKMSKNDLMGPVGISSVVAKTTGIQDFLYIMTVISLSLGFTNLLPFPPLDGGKIVLLIIEGIRRKPLKEKVEVGIQMLGFAVMIMLSIYITYNDVLRLR